MDTSSIQEYFRLNGKNTKPGIYDIYSPSNAVLHNIGILNYKLCVCLISEVYSTTKSKDDMLI